MRDNQSSENAYLDEIYGDDNSDHVEAHLNELSYQDMSGGFTDDELTYMLSDESRFSWLLRSDFQTIRAWLDTGKDIYTTPDNPTLHHDATPCPKPLSHIERGDFPLHIPG